MTELEYFRAEKDEFFLLHPQSPLTAEQKQDFQGLRYFPPNPALRLEVEIEETSQKTEVQVQISTGGAQTYTRLGTFKFSVEGQEAELALYAGPHGYFLPFVDSLAGSETYAAGRYVEPERLGSGMFRVDFNYAYNPFCAYNERWACPLTPAENRLQVPIRAGEKSFHA